MVPREGHVLLGLGYPFTGWVKVVAELPIFQRIKSLPSQPVPPPVLLFGYSAFDVADGCYAARRKLVETSWARFVESASQFPQHT
jgi:hypothetical protein